MQWISFTFICAVILMRGIKPDWFVVDGYTLFLLVVVSIPFIAPFLKSFKMLGGQFDFKDAIAKIEEHTRNSVDSSKQEAKVVVDNYWPAAFELEKPLLLVDEDPTLALASLRMEIERVIKTIYLAHREKPNTRLNLSKMINAELERGSLTAEQVSALKEILIACNKAIHGNEVSRSEAINIIKLTEQLGSTFSTGYIPNVKANPYWEEQGYVCEWQHCIELSPFSAEKDANCHIFGHDCPGGVKRQLKCKEDWKSN